MTNEKVIALHSALGSIKSLKGVQFNYAIARNIAKIQSDVEAFQKTIEASPEYTEYDTKRIALAKEHARKDDKGEPVTETKNNVSIYVIDDMIAFNAALDALQKDHKKAIDERDAQIKEANEFLKKDSDIILYKIPLTSVPEEITTEQMNSILDIIE